MRNFITHTHNTHHKHTHTQTHYLQYTFHKIIYANLLMTGYALINSLINRFLTNSSNWQCFSHKCFMSVPHRKHTKGNGQNSGGREALKSRDKRTRREVLLGGDKIEWYRG